MQYTFYCIRFPVKLQVPMSFFSEIDTSLSSAGQPLPFRRNLSAFALPVSTPLFQYMEYNGNRYPGALCAHFASTRLFFTFRRNPA